VCVCVYGGPVFSDLSLNLFIFCFKETRGIFTNVVRQTVMLLYLYLTLCISLPITRISWTWRLFDYKLGVIISVRSK